jgi:hypothetical protein
MKQNKQERILNKLKKVINDCIDYEEQEKAHMQELQLPHLREKHHYKMRAYRWILKELDRIESGEK